MTLSKLIPNLLTPLHKTVLPVVTIENIDDAIPISQALQAGGIHAIEITLRTPDALTCIEKIRKHTPTMLVGAGTILNPQMHTQAVNAGAQFLVSPGATPQLLEHAAANESIPLVPGVTSPSEIMLALSYGFNFLKFFPAEAYGGVKTLKSLAGPFQNVRFCPTGGITAQTAPDYLKLGNVECIGGSWLTPKATIKEKNWHIITEIAEKTTAFSRVT